MPTPCNNTNPTHIITTSSYRRHVIKTGVQLIPFSSLIYDLHEHLHGVLASLFQKLNTMVLEEPARTLDSPTSGGEKSGGIVRWSISVPSGVSFYFISMNAPTGGITPAYVFGDRLTR
jgi:hypothetical protein